MMVVKLEPLKGIPLSQPWRGWIEQIKTAVDNSATKVVGASADNILITDSDGDLVDSGSSLPSGVVVDEEWVAERFITDSPLREADEEDGARYGSYRIGLLTDDDYAYFDENGKLIFYGTAGVRLITPVDAGSDLGKFAVFDASGNIKYRTAAELIADLSGDAAASFSMNSQKITALATPTVATDASTKDYVDSQISTFETGIQEWVSERFITENLLDEEDESVTIILTGTDGKTVTVTQDTSLDEAVAMSSKAPTADPTFTGIVTTAGQIAFPSVANPSADAHTLDDYEEGEWTPGIAFGGASVDVTYSASNGGLYIKIGSLVTLTGFLGLTNKGSSVGIATITGIPFVSKNATGNIAAVSLFLSGITFANAFMGFIPLGGSIIYLNEVTEAGVDSGLANTDFANNSYIQFSVTYFTS